MLTTLTSSGIADHYLNRKAIVYVRQSSNKQVRENKESQRLQYALKDKAKEWGWQDVEIVDCDLGSSATAGAPRRAGFDKTIAEIAVGVVGIIFNREASRLARTDKDWCRLFEVCELCDTLISDGERIYDYNNADDRLTLGIKATLSAAEWKTLQLRMVKAMEAKAKRGEFMRALPPGYVWSSDGKIVKDPDQRVVEAIELIFSKFRELRSIRQTFLWFHEHGIELPVTKKKAGGRGIVWQPPKKSFISHVLQNVTYAGVYVWGQAKNRIEFVDGEIQKARKRESDPRKANIFIENHHEGYIDLSTFDENQLIITSNSMSQTQVERVGAAKNGQGLLAGLMRCGKCGRKMSVRYYGKSGTAARYVCRGDYESGGEYCLAFGGSTVDKRLSQEIVDAISMYGKEAGLGAVAEVEQEDEESTAAAKRKLQQLEYEATRAFEQYNEVDPRNRLVAAELERRWNSRLEAFENAKRELREIESRRHILTEKEKRRIMAFGAHFASVWSSKGCSNSLRKNITRTVINEVVVNLDVDTQTLSFVIHWKGGCHTSFEMPKPPAGVGLKTSQEDLSIIRSMSHRYGDDAIARVLNRLGRRTASGKRWNESRVGTIRGKYSIAGHIRTVQDPDVLTLGEAAAYLQVSKSTIKKLVTSGVLERRQVVPWAPWEISRKDLDSDRIRDIIGRLRRTGKVVIEEDSVSSKQPTLFP